MITDENDDPNKPIGDEKATVPEQQKETAEKLEGGKGVSFAGGVVDIDGPVVGGNVGELVMGNKEIRQETVFGDQVQGDKIGRDKIVAEQYIGQLVIEGEGKISWETIDYSRHLERSGRLFVEHMSRFAGAANVEGAVQRYLPLLLQDAHFSESIVTDENINNEKREERQQSKWRGLWEERVNYPQKLFIAGEAGSGKTTLLLFECRRLSLEAQNSSESPIPIYLPLRRYDAWSKNLLLQRMAEGTGLDMRIIQAMWQKRRRPICLFLDGADEVPGEQLNNFVDAIVALERSAPANFHSFIISHRQDEKLDGLLETLNWPGLHLLPLDNTQLRGLLGRYGIEGLERYLDAGLQELLQTPDLLSALALSWRDAAMIQMPRNMGEIYQLYIDRYLFSGDEGSYDYQSVKRPVLAFIAYTMITHERSNWLFDEGLEAHILQMLSDLDAFYRRRRQVLPDDWSVKGLLEELARSPALSVERQADDTFLISFSKAGYRDYYAAVYVALREEGQEDAFEANKVAWLPVLLILAGITPSGSELFDRVYGSQPALAADLWLENRPVGLQAPAVIRDAVQKGITDQEQRLQTGIDEPLTAKLLVRMLDDAEPRERLRAIGALSQWGLTGIDPLLDAALDSHPILAATAMYALLHLGETRFENGLERPLQPLFDADNGFRSAGCCLAAIGPLTYISAPQSVRVMLNVLIERLSFDLFDSPATFSLWRMPPHWYVADLLERRQEVVWPELLARLLHISGVSKQVQMAARKNELLSSLADELRRREFEYAALAYFLARDLGLLEFGGVSAYADYDLEAAETIYRRMRNIYSLSNRDLFFAPLGAANVAAVGTNLNIDSAADGARVVGFQVDSNGDYFPQNREEQFHIHNLNLRVEEVSSSRITGLQYAEFYESATPLPFSARVNLNFNVENARDSRLTGVGIEKLHQAVGGVMFSLNVHIGRLIDSRIAGLVVEEVISA